MNNTGRLVYKNLTQYNEDTGLPTGIKKPNVVGDPDYLPPQNNLIICPLPSPIVTAWRGINPICELSDSKPIIGQLRLLPSSWDVISLEWDAATDNVGILSYEIYGYNYDWGPKSMLLGTVLGDVLSHDLLDLELGSYTLTIRAMNFYGEYSGFSNSVQKTIFPNVIIEPDPEPGEGTPEPPAVGCRAHFTGRLMSDTDASSSGISSEIYKVDSSSELVGSGNYPDNSITFPKSILNTFDGIAVDEGTRVIVYEKKNFKGKVLVDMTGPALMNNYIWNTEPKYQIPHNKDFKEPLQSTYPQSVRKWSTSNMHAWKDGSTKITCGNIVTDPTPPPPPSGKKEITEDTSIFIYTDWSGSMELLSKAIERARTGSLKQKLFPIYKTIEQYESKVGIYAANGERPLDWLQMEGMRPEKDVIVLVFCNETHSASTRWEPSVDGYYKDLYPPVFNDFTYHYWFERDHTALKNALDSFPKDYYSGVLFQVEYEYDNGTFKSFAEMLAYGLTGYGLSMYPNLNFKFDIQNPGINDDKQESENYVTDLILNALRELNFNI